MTKILNYGSINIDHVYRVSHVVAPGETIAAQEYTRHSGGKGANQSVALARAGANVFHIGQIGDDGETERRLLAENGVNVDFVIRGNTPTGCAIIQVADNGENSIVILGGANITNSIDHLDQALASVSSGDYFVTQNETNDLPAALHQAKKHGLITCFNPAPCGPEVLRYPFEAVDIMIMNESEALGLTGKDAPLDALQSLTDRYPAMELVLTLGAQGGYYCSGGERLSFDAVPVDNVVDTTAAGDCFIGYYIAGRSQGLPPLERLSRAAEAAALTVGKKGAIPSIPVL